MQRERLRMLILDGIDRITSHPFLIQLTAEQKDALAAVRRFWDRDDGTQLDRVLGYVNERRETMSANPTKITPEQLNDLLASAGAAAPYLLAFLQRLIAAFGQRQGAAPADAGCCDDPDVCRCCDEALAHQAAALAALLHCRTCCTSPGE